MRFSTLIGLLLLALLPGNAYAFWIGGDGQCVDGGTAAWAADHSPVEVEVSDCEGAFDPTDPSYNACFELAEHPISTLPHVVAENQALQLAAALVGTSTSVANPGRGIAPWPSPSEASVEDPVLPGQPLVERPALPRAPANACAVYPDDCERAPTTPTLNLEASSPAASSSFHDFTYPPTLEQPTHRGPPAEGVGPAAGVRARLDRPPQVG